MSKVSTPPLPIFLHLESTGGVSLRKNLLEPNCGEHGVVNLYGMFKTYRAFRKEKIDAKCLIGHIEFGIHNVIPLPTTYFTLLRSPIRRAVSYYYFVHEFTNEEYTASDYDLAMKYGLVDFYAKTKLDNLQTRKLAGVIQRAFPSCNSFLLQKAKRNLSDHFSAVGITERFSEAQELFQKCFDWPLLEEHPKQVARKKLLQTEETIPAEDRRRLEDIHSYDLELYEFATALFEEQLKRHAIGH